MLMGSMADHLGTTLPAFASLAKPNIHFNDVRIVTDKLKELLSGGKQMLQIITDFDRTLTKDSCHEPIKTSYAILEICSSLSDTFRNNCLKLRDEYHPIEIDPNMSVDEKIPYMIEWWKKGEDLFKGLELKKTTIESAVEEADVHFREGCDVMFRKLRDNSIPVLVFSAGVGDVIDAVLRRASLDHPNVHVVSNFLKYDGDIVTGYRGPFIHIFNKNKHAIEKSDYFQEIKERRNVLLMGDSLGDADMAEGVPEQGTVLRIGFLTTKHIDNYLPQFLAKFDIVLVDDQTMAVPMLILDNILSQSA